MSRSTLVIEAFDDPLTLDPHRAFETASRHPVLNLYDGLLGLDDSRRLVPRLAASLPVRGARRRGEEIVVVPIRGGIRFHDGAPLTVDDVVYSLRRMAITAPGPGALWADALLGAPRPRLDPDAAAEVAGRIEGTADGVLLRLCRPYGPLEALLVQWSLVVSRAWCAARGEWDGTLRGLGPFVGRPAGALDRAANGTGRYALEAWDDDRREIRLRRFETGAATATASEGAATGAEPGRVVLRSVDDRRQRERNLLAGDCDFAVCQPESRPRLGSLDGVVLERLPEEWIINPLGFITQRLDDGAPAVLPAGRFDPGGLPADAFTDVHLRRTLSLCFDHEGYAATVLDGDSVDHAAPFPAPAVPGLVVRPARRDLAGARAEFARAWDGRLARTGCRIVICTHAANIARVEAARYLAEGLAAVSPRIVPEVRAMDFATLLEMFDARRCPVAWLGWNTDFLHPFAFASTLLDPRSPLPATVGIDDPELSRLVSELRELDGADADAANLQLVRYASEQALFVVPPGKVSYLTFSDRWQGVRLKDHIPNVLDFDSFRLRTAGAASQ